ncbi:Gfo/Idh/MocA family protein [Pseudonocardia bannensis]|uniref:Gfo/Idh/MocA family oxidoreductase n=1 Tax=Pseudonocardia bannensis TaxID=630973 RepID=A0A848DJE7_9PSEU|nr:Gfo/Idh/MocA family oxidoreductase [Pseudonocardia bannensis]NMH92656.1 Gfo/Idh/MocA family oxidoreductase [Pseudonocardia bannensis]
MAAVERLRIGLVGAGPWARRVHAPAIAAHPGTTLAGVWSRRRSSAEDLGPRAGGRVYDRVADLLDDVDAVAFAVPPRVQADLVPVAAAAGRHVILEKPLADSLGGARAVADAVAAASVCSTTMLTLRFDPVIRGWLAGLPDGPAGPDTIGSARWLSGALLGGPYAGSGWRAEHGALLDVGPHVIDLLDAALGPVTGVDWAHRTDPDTWRFGLVHAGGARSTTTVSLRLPVDPSEVEVAVFGGAGRHVVTSKPADARACYGVLLDEFCDAVAGGRTSSPCDADRALHVQEIIEQVRSAGR